MEIWKDIKGYEGIYQVSSYGNVRSIDRICERILPNGTIRYCKQKGRIIALQLNPGTRTGVSTRYQVGLSKECKVKQHQVHRLVAFAFLDGSEDLEVNHKDGNPLNNHIENLELITKTENIQHAFKNNLIKTAKRVSELDLDTKVVIKEYESTTKCAEKIGISQTWLSRKLNLGDFEYNGFIYRYK